MACGRLNTVPQRRTDKEQQREQVAERQNLEKDTPATASALLSLKGHHQLLNQAPVAPRFRRQGRLFLAKQTPLSRRLILLRLCRLVAPARLLIRFPVTHPLFLNHKSIKAPARAEAHQQN